jgi:hypothetical protein
MTYATVDDVQKRFPRDLDDSEAGIVAVRLADAEELILQKIPDLTDRTADGQLSERQVVMAEVEAVLRLVRNPEGYVSETDGNYSYTLSQRVASGRLTIDWDTLGVSSGVGLIGLNGVHGDYDTDKTIGTASWGSAVWG